MAIFDADVVTAVLKHMNEDHPDDNLLIARAFGDESAQSSTMTGLDGSAATWSYVAGDETQELSLPWSKPISERAEIRREVVVLYDSACVRLAIEPRAHD